MCGICGYVGYEQDSGLLQKMARMIQHRGPDDDGFYQEKKIGLAMRRLSIIDVAGGRQPIEN